MDLIKTLLPRRSKPIVAVWQNDYGGILQDVNKTDIAHYRRHHRLEDTEAHLSNGFPDQQPRTGVLSTAGQCMARGTCRTAVHGQQPSDRRAQDAASTNHNWTLLLRDRQLTQGQRHNKQAYKNPSHQVGQQQKTKNTPSPKKTHNSSQSFNQRKKKRQKTQQRPQQQKNQNKHPTKQKKTKYPPTTTTHPKPNSEAGVAAVEFTAHTCQQVK